MEFIHSREDVTSFLKELGISIKDDSIDILQQFLEKLSVDKDDLEADVESFCHNDKIKELNYKNTLALIDYIKKEEGSEKTQDEGLKRTAIEMTPPSTPLKKQHINPAPVASSLATPASGRVYDVSESPSKRHEQSPKTWPTPVKSEVFSSRKERNTIKTSFDMVDSTICDEVAEYAESIEFTVVHSVGEQNSKARFVPPVEDKEILRSAICSAREIMNQKYNKSFTNISYETECEVCICGKIYFDSQSTTILKDSSIFLYDENENKVSLILSELPSFTLFPGQIVGVEGIMSNRRIQVQHLYPGYPIVSPTVPTENLQEEIYTLLIARGPFTSRDDSSYEQLQAFIEVVNEKQPHLVILCGPFLPESYSQSLQLNTGFDSSLLTMLKKITVPILLIPSLDDTMSFPAFPQPPYSCPSSKLHCAGNPSWIEINKCLQIGIVNTDILKDLMVNSYRKQTNSIDNQTLFCSQLIQQQSFYPLYPTTDIPFDSARIATLNFAAIPDIVIVATDKMKFIKDVEHVLFVSPGPLALGNGGGTYASITVYPFKKEYIEEVKKQDVKEVENKVVQRCKAQIMVL